MGLAFVIVKHTVCNTRALDGLNVKDLSSPSVYSFSHSFADVFGKQQYCKRLLCYSRRLHYLRAISVNLTLTLTLAKFGPARDHQVTLVVKT